MYTEIIDSIFASDLEIGDIFEWNGKPVEVTRFEEDRLMCYIELDTGEEIELEWDYRIDLLGQVYEDA